MKKSLPILFALVASVIILSSCSNDDDYSVKLPIYSDVIFTVNGETVNSADIPLGQNVAITLVQKTAGRNIYLYSYGWSYSGQHEGLAPNMRSNISANVANSFTPTETGTYTMTIRVKYNYSGNSKPTVMDTSGNTNISVTYVQGGDLYSNAVITKTITVK